MKKGKKSGRNDFEMILSFKSQTANMYVHSNKGIDNKCVF